MEFEGYFQLKSYRRLGCWVQAIGGLRAYKDLTFGFRDSGFRIESLGFGGFWFTP